MKKYYKIFITLLVVFLNFLLYFNKLQVFASKSILIKPTSCPTINTDNFKTNESVPIAFVHIKVPNRFNQYLKVKKNGSLTFTSNSKHSSIFALYKSNSNAKVGFPIEPTIQLQNTNSGKFLTIQSYKKNHYYNKKNGLFFITCKAPNVGWNERFNFKQTRNGQTALFTHLNAIRDQKGSDDDFIGNTFYTINSDNEKGLISQIKKSRPEYFKFVETHQQTGKIPLATKIVNNKAIIYWHKVNNADTIQKYKISVNSKIRQKGNFLYAIVPLTHKGNKVLISYHSTNIKLKGQIKLKSFRHPGIRLVTKQLNAMKNHIARKEEPWYSDYLLLKYSVANNLSSSKFIPQFSTAIGRGDAPSSGNIGYLEQSGNAAYFNALLWVIEGKKQYAEKTKDILNTWSKLKIIDGRDRILGAGLNSVKLATAADILSSYHSGYSNYSKKDLAKLKKMMINVIYPVLQDAGIPMLANGNWDLAAIEGMIAIAVLNDDYSIYNKAIKDILSPYINGSLQNYIDKSGQTQEAGRDMAHAQLGVGLLAEIINTAKNQGNNFLSRNDYCLAKASEWVAQYNLTYQVPSFRVMNNIFGKTDIYSFWTTMDSQTISRGELRPIYEEILALYKNKKVNLFWTKKAAIAMRPQGMINNDNYNFDTLTFYNGPKTNKPEPIFNLRTRVEPWYNRQIQKNNKEFEYEPYFSYFSVSNEGIIANKRQSEADSFKLITNKNGTFSILDLKNNKFLNIRSNSNKIFASANIINDQSEFNLISTGLGFYAITPKTKENQLLETLIVNKNDPKEAELTLTYSASSTSARLQINNQNRFIFMYKQQKP